MLPGTLPKRRARLRLLCATVALGTATASAADRDAADHCIVGDDAIGCRSERALIELTSRHQDAGTLQDLVRDKLASGQCRLFDYGERVQLISTHDNERSHVRLPGERTSYWIASSWSRPASECADTPSAAALHRKLGLPNEFAPRTYEDDRVPAFAFESPPPRQRRYDDESDRYDDEPDRVRGPAFADGRAPPQGQRYDDDGLDDGYARDNPRDDDYAYDNDYARDNDHARDDDYRDDRGAGPFEPSDRDARFTGRHSRRPPPWPTRPLPSSRYAHHCDSDADMTDADLAACSNARR